MSNLKKLVLSLMIVCTLAMNAVAEGGPDCNPGQTSSPPCVSKSVIDVSTSTQIRTVPAQTNTQPAYNSAVDAIDLAEAVLWALSLF